MTSEDKKQYVLEQAELHFRNFMQSMQLDIQDQSLKDTPRRVAKMFVYETCASLFKEPPPVTVFENDGRYDGMVLVKNIEIKSLCEHHFQPFIGTCHIGYIPGEKIIGLSKFSRIADYFARKPQVQERLTMEIFNHLKSILETDNIAVYVEAEHYCMKIRGVEEPCSSTITSKLGGGFLDKPEVRQEFYSAISKG